jgi:hypothetical protein
MLTITKIIEGGLDLATRQELPRSMVISNGVREISVAMSDHEMENIIQLYIEGLQVERKTDAGQIVQHIKETVAPPEEVVKTSVRMMAQKPVGHIEVKFQVPSDYDEPPPTMVPQDDEDGFQPGEEYDDSGTGASSL